MLININVTQRQQNEFSDTLTKEQRDHARRQMTGQLAQLLARSPGESLYWMESKTDLMDMVHEAFMTELLVDSQGRPYSFAGIAKRACAVLHVPEPSNPYSIAYKARGRKGVRQKSFFSRYCWMLYCKNISNPLNGMIRKICLNEE